MLVVGAIVLWLADRWGARTKGVEDVTFPLAFGSGGAGAGAVPGISRSGSRSRRPLRGPRPRGGRAFSFLMATPITPAPALRDPQAATGRRASTSARPLVVGMIAAFVSGSLAIGFLLRYLRTRSLDVFVVYRLVLARVVVVVWLR
jgi:undecaprenyl-diphosphatase